MTRKPRPSDWHFGFVAGASDGGSSEPPKWIADTAAYLAGFADGQAHGPCSPQSSGHSKRARPREQARSPI